MQEQIQEKTGSILKIIFLTLASFSSSTNGIYSDLLSYFKSMGSSVVVVCPVQRKYKKNTYIEIDNDIKILHVKTFNVTGECTIIEKGIGTILIEYQFIQAIKKYLCNENFDCVIYSTPPVTFSNVVRFIKKSFCSKSYLLLKDIFPQNAVDLQYFSKKSFAHYFFKKKEKKLYIVSDYIGCMSPANKKYLLEHETYLNENNIEINPNSIFPHRRSRERTLFFKYNIPQNKTVFIYGGNLGKPQGVSFLIECIKYNEKRDNSFFVIVGDGLDRYKLEMYFKKECPNNAIVLPYLDKEEYEDLCASCDVGLVFLDARFTIPNFPSRILSYMQHSIPYIAAVDSVTDVGTIAEKYKFGFNCLWGDLDSFNNCVDKILEDPCLIEKMGKNARKFFLENYTVEKSYQTIMQHFE